jgi:hypothetical protein
VIEVGSRVSQLTEWLHELRNVRQEWLDVHASTEPADRYEAEFGIALAYDTAGLTPPHTVIWAPDPASGAAVAAVLSRRGTRTSGKVWAEARQRGRRAAALIYTNRAWDQAFAATRFPEWDRVEPAIRSAALGLVFASRTAKPPAVHSGLTQSVWRAQQARLDAAMSVWGQHSFWSHNGNPHHQYRKRAVQLANEALGLPEVVPSHARSPLPAYYEVRECLDWALGQRSHLEELALLEALWRFRNGSSLRAVEGLVRVARSAGWWWPFEDVAVVCERPSVRALDREGRLHAEGGPALAYRDGFSGYFWHGRLVPRWAVAEPTVARIAAEANVEVRRCAIEAMGWARFTEEAGLKLVDLCADPGNAGQRLELYTVPSKVWGMPANVLVCTNGSVDLDGGRHTFGLLVPVTVKSALGAAAWGYGLTAEEYAGLERRA